MKRNESYLLFKKYAYKGQIMGYKKFHEALLEFSATMTRESTQQQQQVSVEPVVKPACETDKENIKYTCHYGKPIKYRTSFDI